jgi:predicted O-methyltransferase YrrM
MQEAGTAVTIQSEDELYRLVEQLYVAVLKEASHEAGVALGPIAEMCRLAHQYIKCVQTGGENYLNCRKDQLLRLVYMRHGAKTLLRRLSGMAAAGRAPLEQLIRRLPEFADPVFRFTVDFLSPATERHWREDLAPLASVPGLRAVEVGCLEGRTTLWLLANVLNERSSHITCIDTFDFEGQGVASASPIELFQTGDDIESRFDHNIALAGESGRVTKMIGRSQEILRKLPGESFDFIYIDGSHRTADVLEDGVLAWGLLKIGGLLTFDDYQWKPQGDTERLYSPARAIDAILDIFGPQLKLVRKDEQVTIRRSK